MTSIEPTTYQILVVRQGLKACKLGTRLNRNYTPKNLKRVTENLTGLKFKGYPYDEMIEALNALLPKVE